MSKADLLVGSSESMDAMWVEKKAPKMAALSVGLMAARSVASWAGPTAAM